MEAYKNDDDDSNPNFWFALTSNLIFLLGSCLYLVLAVESLEWYQYIYDYNVPKYVVDADDDWTWNDWYYNMTNYNETDDRSPWEDDYVFQVKDDDVDSWVTRYMMFYFAAAFCFLLTGLLDFIRERHWFHLIMILAASFGIASSMLIVKDERLALIFNAVSVHLFALEALFLLVHQGAQCRIALMVANLFFFIGTVMDVVLSYFYVYDQDRLPHGRSSVAAAFFWLACAFTYVCVTIYLKLVPRVVPAAVENQEPAKEEMMEDTSTIPESPRGGTNQYAEEDASSEEEIEA